MAHVFMFILSVLFLTDIVVGYTQFGCDFMDQKYKAVTKFTGNNHEQPVWGGEIQTATFTSEEFVVFKDFINKMYEKVLEDFVFDTMDGFIQFYDAYKKAEHQTIHKLDEFYLHYKQPYRPSVDEAGFVIALVAEMAKGYRNVAKKVFLSTCSSNVPAPVIDLFNANNLTDRLPIDWFHGNIAGIIKITVDGSKGFVFLNFWLALEKRFVSITNKGSSGLFYYLSVPGLSHNMPDTTGKNVEYFADSAQRYILAKSKNLVDGVEVKNGEKYEQLCYIGKPYCSFLQTTSKPHLTRPRYSMIRYDKTNGNLVAALEANFIYNPVEKKMNTTITVQTTLGSNEIRNEISDEQLRTLSAELGKPVNYMKDIIEKLLLIKKDRSFFEDLQEIDTWYNRGRRNQAGQEMIPLLKFITIEGF